MSLASDTRREVKNIPYLCEALRAGIINYSATGRSLGLEGEDTAISVSLQRLRNELPPLKVINVEANIPISSDESGKQSKILVEGDINAKVLSHLILICHINEVLIEEIRMVKSRIEVVVEWRDGPNALRLIELSLKSVPI